MSSKNVIFFYDWLLAHFTLKKTVILSIHQNIKQLFALVCETQKYSSVLQEIIYSTKLLKETKLTVHLAKVDDSTVILTCKTHVCVCWRVIDVSCVKQVLVYDLLIGRGVKCGGTWKTMMLKHRSRLQAALARIKVKRKICRNQDLLPSSLQQTQGNGDINYLYVTYYNVVVLISILSWQLSEDFSMIMDMSMFMYLVFAE